MDQTQPNICSRCDKKSLTDKPYCESHICNGKKNCTNEYNHKYKIRGRKVCYKCYANIVLKMRFHCIEK